jgi:diguanylate cyclase (GGDEF)-like protein
MAPEHDAPSRSPYVRELEAAECFSSFGEAVEFALDTISWRLPGSDPFVTRLNDGEVFLHRGSDGPLSGGSGYLGMPLVGAEGRQIGSLCILDREFPDVDDQAVQRLLVAMGRLIVSELERADREQSLRTLAETDPLTGLMNRGSFDRVLRLEWQRARRGEADSRLVLADVNGLKRVNDELGHLRGDELLRDVADAIEEAARESDAIGRIGGDEFGVVLVGGGERGEARFKERLADQLEARATGDVSPSVAVGGTALAEAHNLDAGLAHADARMYRDKRRRFKRSSVVERS